MLITTRPSSHQYYQLHLRDYARRHFSLKLSLWSADKNHKGVRYKNGMEESRVRIEWNSASERRRRHKGTVLGGITAQSVVELMYGITGSTLVWYIRYPRDLLFIIPGYEGLPGSCLLKRFITNASDPTQHAYRNSVVFSREKRVRSQNSSCIDEKPVLVCSRARPWRETGCYGKPVRINSYYPQWAASSCLYSNSWIYFR